MNLLSKLFLAVFIFSALSLSAQDEVEEESTKPTLSVSGSVDAYFRTNIGGGTNNPETGGTTDPGTSFANSPGFSLGMANLVLGMDGKKSGFVADLVFGPRGADAVFGSQQSVLGSGVGDTLVVSGNNTIVNQLYAYWKVSEKTTLTIGNFNTFLGYEVISPASNFNYSTSYMFSNGPFSHTGLKADFALTDDFSLMLAVMNPTDATDNNPNDTYAYGAQLGYAGQYLNFLYEDDLLQVDFTGGVDVSDDFYIGLNATTKQDNFSGVAGYLQYSFSDSFSLGLREEYFQFDGGNTILATTLSANVSAGGLVIIPELRLDSADSEIYTDSTGKTSKALSSFSLAAVYAF